MWDFAATFTHLPEHDVYLSLAFCFNYIFIRSESDSNQMPIIFDGHMNMTQNAFVQNTEGHKKYILFRNLRGE